MIKYHLYVKFQPFITIPAEGNHPDERSVFNGPSTSLVSVPVTTDRDSSQTHTYCRRYSKANTESKGIGNTVRLNTPSQAFFPVESVDRVLLRFTSQLYILAVFTSITVSCSRRNSRSSMVAFRLASAAPSLDRSSDRAAGILYDNMTFAYRDAVSR